jgi:hypothetical protein
MKKLLVLTLFGLLAFTVKVPFVHAAETLYTTVDPIYPGDPDPGWDDDAYEFGGTGIVGGYYCVDSSRIPVMTYNGATIVGTVTADEGKVGMFVANDETAPPGPASTGSGISTFGTTYKWYQECTIDGHPSTNTYTLSITSQEEIAYTKFLATGYVGTDCYTAGTVTICSYPVAPWCSNTSTPDYVVVGVNDSAFHAAWYSLGACTRLVNGGVPSAWGCIPLAAVGTTNSIKSPSCTYNP